MAHKLASDYPHPPGHVQVHHSHFTINVAANFVVYIKDNLHLVSSEPVQSPQLIWDTSQEYIEGNDSLDHSSGEEHRNSNMLRVK